jgi:hypothetical protein
MEKNDEIQLHDLKTIEARLCTDRLDARETDVAGQELESVSEFMIN